MLVDSEAARDFQTNDRALSARGTPAGNIYSGLTLGGDTRAILGNIFYTTHNNVTPSTQQTAEEKRHEKLMETLAFDRMDFRRATIEPAHTRTCRWIFEEEAFSKWRDAAFRATNHGFLWIKGKPGSGKSTLMKCILNHITSHAPECNIISFFFNARGESLERSTEGCYRSLLHQMLKAFPKLRTSIRIPHSLGKGQAPPIAMLQNIFHEAVLSLQQEHLVVMIDALDECDQQEIRSMVQSLGSLAQACELQGVTLNTCFASRHYPSITVRVCETLLMEGSEGHTQDILMYARDSLAIKPYIQRKEILEQVMRKAEGVFLWAVLVVRILNEQFDEGRSHFQLLDATSNLPGDLIDLIGKIISDGAADPRLLPTLILIFSGDIMSTDELFSGINLIAGGAAHPRGTGSAELPFMKRFIVNASKGLVEWVGGIFENITVLGDAHHFQFIHESVRQHVVAGGLQKVKPSLASNVKANCATLLVEWCKTSLRKRDANAALPLWNSDFVCYAERSIWRHLYTAYAEKTYDLKRLHDFPLKQYVRLGLASPALKPSASLLYVLLNDGARFLEITVTHDLVRDLIEHCSRCSSTVQNGRTSMSCSEFLLGRDLNDYCAGEYGTSLVAALSHMHHGKSYQDLVVLLLNAGADVNVCSGGREPSAYREDDHSSPLSVAVQSHDQSEHVIKLLLDRGADINIRGTRHGSALGAAAFGGHRRIIQLLMDRGADVNLEDSAGCNIALKVAAAALDNARIVEMLVRAGAHVKVGSMDRVRFKTPCRFI
jgi:hypothetical protein